MGNYSLKIGLWKTFKNSAVLLVPFIVAMLAAVPAEYAWVAGPIVYMLKNWYGNR